MEERVLWPASAAGAGRAPALPVLSVESIGQVFSGEAWPGLAALLMEFLKTRRWFGAKARPMRRLQVLDAIPLLHELSYFLIAWVDYEAGEPDRFLLPLRVATGAEALRVMAETPMAVLARVTAPDTDGVLYDSMRAPAFASELLDLVGHGQPLAGREGQLTAWTSPEYSRRQTGRLESSLHEGEQSNSSILYGDTFILKLFRRLEAGINPDLEICAYLSQKAGFAHVPAVAGALEYRTTARPEAITLAFLQRFVPNHGDAWRYTLREVTEFFTRVAERPAPEAHGAWLNLVGQRVPAAAESAIGDYLGSARLLGRRTAEMHVALAQAVDDPEFAPEPMTDGYRRVLANRIAAEVAETFALLRRHFGSLPEAAVRDAEDALASESEAVARCRALRDRHVDALRTRHHGDYHLGQVLYTGDDFVVIDFEGEPARPLRERRTKRSPLRDVAGMLRSFHYASQTGQPRSWGRYWNTWVSVAFLAEYLRTAAGAPFLPRDREEFNLLLSAYLLEKAAYEVRYELNNRPAWVSIPLRGILELLGAE